MITALDTNVVLDVLIPGAAHSSQSKRLLDDALAAGALVICEIVYAELAAHFIRQDALDAFMDDTTIRLSASTRETLVQASSVWRDYLVARTREGLRCTACGKRIALECPACGEPARIRQHILADFLVGAHATKQADRLLTRDLGYYRRWFPDLGVLNAD